MVKVYNDRPYGIEFSYKGKEYFFPEMVKDEKGKLVNSDSVQEIDEALAEELIENFPDLKIKGKKETKEEKPEEIYVKQLSPIEVVAEKMEAKKAMEKNNAKEVKAK